MCKKWARCLGALGERWKSIGSTKPMNGKELINSKLADTLQSKTVFTQKELGVLGINEGELRLDTFVKSGSSYFQLKVGGQLKHMEATLKAMGAANAPAPRPLKPQLNNGVCIYTAAAVLTL